MAKNNFYITTTLPYVNAEPHLGFALEIVQADVIARYHAQLGEEVFFNTGTDEHGAKIFKRALENKTTPQEFCDQNAQKYKSLNELLNLSVNSFIRTTDDHHVMAAQEFWKRCQKDIYKAKYKIKYCTGCELEKTESELIDGKCPLHPDSEIEIREEENYFFKFSKYQEPLLSLYKNNPEFVLPKHRLTEIKNFVEAGPQDFSVSRLKEKMPWGVPVPDDPDHVMYVWFDALVNYISALGWPDDEKKFNEFWPGVQIAGKDNLRQQAAMWQAMLMSAGLSPSKQILIHGFITSSGQKMSKSLGNVVDPFGLVKKYGTDAVRYYLLKEVPTSEDGDFTEEHFKEVYNADLANGLGNLVSRVAAMVKKSGYFEKHEIADGKILEPLENFEIGLAIKNIRQIISACDQKIEKEKPWQLAKTDPKKLKEVLADLVSQLLFIARCLVPFLPETSKKIEDIFSGKEIENFKPLFPRL